MTEPNAIDMDTLKNILERFGADVERWPVEDRTKLEAFMRSHPEATVQFKEFRALDRLLTEHQTNHSLEPTRHDALMESILAAVVDEREVNLQGDNVVAFQPASKKTSLKQNSFGVQLPDIAAASALAASLLLGISIGVTGVADQTLMPVSEALGLSSLGNDVAALSDPIFDVVDVDTFEDELL